MKIENLVEQFIEEQPTYQQYWSDAFLKNPSDAIYKSFVGSNLPNNTLFVVTGSDMGCLVEFLASHYKTGQKFVVVDYPEVLDFIGQKVLPRLPEVFQQNLILSSFADFNFDSLHDFANEYVVRNATVLLKSIVVDQKVEKYVGCFENAQEAFQRFSVNRIDNRNFGNFYDSQIFNACDFVHPAKLLQDKLDSDIPAIVLGGGPSLDEVLPWLKENQSKVWVFAVGRICKRLISEGITPDFIGTIDYQELSFDYTREGLSLYDSSVLLTGNSPNSQIISQWRGLKAFAKSRFPWNLKAEENYFSEGPTVTNFLLGISLHLGVREVYLAGVDLCYSAEGKTHESQSVESNKGQVLDESTQVENYLGQKMSTNIQLYDARNNFVKQAQEYVRLYPDLKMANLNPQAAVIDHVSHVDANQIELNGDKVNIIELFRDSLGNDLNITRSYLAKLKKEVTFYNQWLHKLIRESEAALELLPKLFENPEKQGQRIKKIIQAKQKVENNLGEDYATFVNYGRKFFLESLNPTESQNEMSQEEIIASFKGFFYGVSETAKAFVAKLNGLKQRVSEREKEIKPNADLSKLAQTWLQNNEPGRFYIWLDHFAIHDYEYYQSKYADVVAEIEKAYQCLLEDNQRLEENLLIKQASPEWFFENLLANFQENNVAGIESLQKHLKTINNQEMQLPLSFSKGLLLEVNKQLEEAYEWYASIDPQFSNFYIQQRFYPLAFHFGQHQPGLLSLEKLCQQDMKFIPQYANALEVMGNLEGAIQILEKYPHLDIDLQAALDLIRFYILSGNTENIESLVNGLLENEHFERSLVLSQLAKIGITFE